MLSLIKNWLGNFKFIPVVTTAVFLLLLAGCSFELNQDQSTLNGEQKPLTSFAEVAQYLREHNNTLPPNYITKEEATALGWVASEGNLQEVAPGKSIGGDRFGNREGLLPKEKNRQYYEADIDYEGGRRNAKRIVYSNDGLIFMTTDHYNSFSDITEEGSIIHDN